jgi:hypothetical protein
VRQHRFQQRFELGQLPVTPRFSQQLGVTYISIASAAPKLCDDFTYKEVF